MLAIYFSAFYWHWFSGDQSWFVMLGTSARGGEGHELGIRQPLVWVQLCDSLVMWLQVSCLYFLTLDSVFCKNTINSTF